MSKKIMRRALDLKSEGFCGDRDITRFEESVPTRIFKEGRDSKDLVQRRREVIHFMVLWSLPLKRFVEITALIESRDSL
jgi:hypothetical protein